MFYSQVILAKKGPLGQIWLAAHFDKKLTKTQIFTTDISESVQRIVNPTNPLALRVSGYLMLGIVRIYSRKVKYLMSDCTEAMWKIKLAFRPGTVDIPDVGGTNLQIDDGKFGHIMPDTEFPELAGVAFSQELLTRYESMSAERSRTIAKHSDTIDDGFGYGNEYSIDIPGLESASKSSVASRSTIGRVSEIELPRQRLRSSLDKRSGLSFTSGSAPTNFMFEEDAPISLKLDDLVDERSAWVDSDHVPAFDDYAMETAPLPLDEEPVPMDQWGDEPEPFVSPSPIQPEADTEEVAEPIRSSRLRVDLSKERERLRAEERQREQQAKQNRRTVTEANAANDSATTTTNKSKQVKVKANKRQKVVIDDRVELPNRVVKERIANVANIVRRQPGDPLPRLSEASLASPASQRLSVPGGISGMCAELQDLYSFTMTNDALPFPSNRPSLAEDQEPVDDIEMPRDGRRTTFGRNSISTIGEASYIVPDVDMSQDPTRKDSIAADNVGPDQSFQSYIDDYQPDTHWEPPLEDTLPVADAIHFNSPPGESPMKKMSLGSGGSPVGAFSVRHSMESTTSTANISSSNSGAVQDTGHSEDQQRKWSSRTASVLSILQEQLQSNDSVSFENLSRGVDRRIAATSFMEILQLKTWGYIDVAQNEPFADIEINSTAKTFAALAK